MDRRLVRKSNYLIEASYKLTAAEQKIVLILASLIKPDDREFKKYSLKIRNIAQIMGVPSNNEYLRLKDVTKSLLGKVFTILTPVSELQTHWFSSAEYFEGQGTVEFTFDPKLKPFLLQLKDRFTTYQLKEAVQLKSSFSIRLLELLRQYEKLGGRVIEIGKLRNYLGIEEDQYRLYADFKRRVILAAQKELGTKTALSFDFEEIKNGHAVEKIRFKIQTRPREEPLSTEALLPTPSKDPEFQQLLQMLPGPYQEKATVKKLLSGYLQRSGFNYVARNIIYSNEKSSAVNPAASSGKPGNYRNYLAKALREDFGLAFLEDREARKASAEKARQEMEAAKAITRQEQEKTHLEQENMERAREFRQNLPPEALEALKQEALAKMDPTERSLATGKSKGAEFTLKLAMDRICLLRMKLA